MEVTPHDIEKGMKTPSVWEKYKKIINNAEGQQVDTNIKLLFNFKLKTIMFLTFLCLDVSWDN